MRNIISQAVKNRKKVVDYFTDRHIIERPLSRFLPNDTAFRISDLGRSRDIDAYNVPLSIFEHYWVSPSKIKRYTGRDYPPWDNRRNLLGKVQFGGWDQYENTDNKFNQRVQFRGARLHFDKGTPLTNVERYEQILPDYYDYEQLVSDIVRIGNIIESIKEHGYMTQEELGEYPNDKRGRYTDEILVDIGRSGEILFVNGSHRLTAAKIMNLDAVPVVVMVRHGEWMEKLEQIIETNDVKELCSNHPDVQKCLNKDTGTV